MGKADWHHLYLTARWKALRASQLKREPLCRFCGQLGRVTAATIADHVKPHKGDLVLFFDPQNLQSLCKTCHDSTKAIQEHRGILVGCDVNGKPLDPNHHWNA